MISQVKLSRRFSAFIAAALLFLTALIPSFFSTVSAGELVNRSTTIDKAYFSATDVQYEFAFELPADTQVQGIVIRWCDGARQETCAQPDNSDGNAGASDRFDASAATIDGQTGWAGAAFTDSTDADAGECDENTNSLYVVCLERTDTTNETAAAGERTITLSGIDHPDFDGDASNFQSIYPHMYLYSDTGYVTQEHFGITAVALTNQLVVSATVAEYLQFCVGTQDIDITDNATEDASGNENCTDLSDTTLNLGTVTFNNICYSDEAAGNPCENADDDKTGYALIATNAANGVSISYRAEQDATPGATEHLGALRIPGAVCTAGSGTFTDPCFESAGTVGIAFSEGTENFGMTVSQVINPDYDTANTVTRAKGSLTNNVSRTAAYDGNGIAPSVGTCTAADAGTDENCWAWDESGNPVEIASSTGVVDDEMLVINYAAAASLTTPTGTYSVNTTFIATPEF